MLFSLTNGMRYDISTLPLADLPHTYSLRSTRRLRIVSLSSACFLKSEKYMAAYRFIRLLSDLCRPQIPKPTPEQFFHAFMDHHAKIGVHVSKDSVVKLMLNHATWLVEEAKRFVDVQSWKEFALTKVLDVDEDRDVEMDETDYEHLARSIPMHSPIPLSPKRKRVRPCT